MSGDLGSYGYRVRWARGLLIGCMHVLANLAPFLTEWLPNDRLIADINP